MNAARIDASQANVAADTRILRGPRTLFGLLLAAVFALPPASAVAQDGGVPMPKFTIGGQQKRKLTPEEEEQQKKIDADYKAASKKIPDQKAADPWADVRQAPAAPGQKASTSTQKKKQSAQQAQ